MFDSEFKKNFIKKLLKDYGLPKSLPEFPLCGLVMKVANKRRVSLATDMGYVEVLTSENEIRGLNPFDTVYFVCLICPTFRTNDLYGVRITKEDYAEFSELLKPLSLGLKNVYRSKILKAKREGS